MKRLAGADFGPRGQWNTLRSRATCALEALGSADLAKPSLVGLAAGDLNAQRERRLGGDGELGGVEAE